MTLKRHFDNEISNEVSNGASFKNQRVEENCGQISLNTNVFSSTGDAQGYNQLGYGDVRTGNNYFDAGQQPANGRLADYRERVDEEAANALPRSLSLSPWAAQSSSDDEYAVDVAMHYSFVPEFFSFDLPARSFRHVEDTYNLLLEYPPKKQVPIGPEYQAEIPDLLPQGEGGSHDDDNIHLSGTCIIPFPESELPVYIGGQVGNGRTDCSCRDRGSFRCVRQHIDEAREKLRSSLDPLAFSELGFNDMGEVVAKKWSQDDEHVFHEVVFANPVSLGKKFWNALSFVFPTRTKLEIVSYYYNVLMLQKRAEQNRVDPVCIDSDNDEWKASEYDDGGGDDGSDEGCLTEDDEDSAVESLISHYGPLSYGGYLAEKNVGVDEVCEEDDNPVLVPRKDLNVSADTSCVFQPLAKAFYDEVGEHDNQDGSCTSSDSGGPSQEAQGKPDNGVDWQEFILEPCDNKLWDTYLSCPENNMDLLPTCRVMDEVFGDGDFDLKGKRW